MLFSFAQSHREAADSTSREQSGPSCILTHPRPLHGRPGAHPSSQDQDWVHRNCPHPPGPGCQPARRDQSPGPGTAQSNTEGLSPQPTSLRNTHAMCVSKHTERRATTHSPRLQSTPTSNAHTGVHAQPPACRRLCPQRHQHRERADTPTRDPHTCTRTHLNVAHENAQTCPTPACADTAHAYKYTHEDLYM